MRRIEFPGGWAQLRSVEDMSVRQRRLLETSVFAASDVLKKLPDNMDKMTSDEQRETMMKLSLSEVDAAKLNAIGDAAIIASIIEWSFGDPPKSAEMLLDIPGKAYDALAEATKEVGAAISAQSFAPNPDQSRPTGASSN